MNPLAALWFFIPLAIYDPGPPRGSSGYPTGAVPDPSLPPDEEPPVTPGKSYRSLPRIHPRILVGYGSVVGAAMIALAWAWAIMLRGRAWSEWFPMNSMPVDVLIGVAVGIVFTLSVTQLLKRIPALQRIERMFLQMLDMRALRWHHALLLGLLAGFPEEILFRGAVQPVLGMLPTSLLFGALHAATPAYFIYATLAGSLLGGLALWRDGLWTAITAHTTIDVLMFLLLMRAWRKSQHTHQSATSTLTDSE